MSQRIPRSNRTLLPLHRAFANVPRLMRLGGALFAAALLAASVGAGGAFAEEARLAFAPTETRSDAVAEAMEDALEDAVADPLEEAIDETLAEEPDEPAAEADDEEAPEALIDVEEEEGLLTLNLTATPLGTFLKIVSEHSDMKLLAEPDLASRPLSIFLRDISPRDALDAVCAAYDLSYEPQSGTNVYIIRERSSAFFSLEHTSASTVQALVTTLAGEGARVAYDEETNVLAVYGGKAGIEKVRAMIESLDGPPKQVLIEATLAELTDDAQKTLGITWGDDTGTFFTADGAARQTNFPFDFRTHGWTYGSVSFRNFLVRLQALEHDGKANVLANPRIAAIHGKEAKIEILTQTAVGVRRTFDDAAGTRVTEEPIFSDVGIVLSTTPRIHPDGRITLHVRPAVSTSSRSPFFEDAVDTFSREADTTLVMNDGQTIAIGGLRRADTQENVRKVPFLGDIPGLGRLFTRRTTESRNVELVVFLTPRLLTDERIAEDVEEHRRNVRREIPLDEALPPAPLRR